MIKAVMVLIRLAILVCPGTWLFYEKIKIAHLNSGMEALLKRGASPDAVGSIGDTVCDCEDNPSPAPALILAIYQTSGSHQEHFDTVVALLRAGADVNARASEGMTALMWASSPRMVSFLLAHGAQVNLKDVRGHTTLDHQDGLENQGIKHLLKTGGRGRLIC